LLSEIFLLQKLNIDQNEKLEKSKIEIKFLNESLSKLNTLNLKENKKIDINSEFQNLSSKFYSRIDDINVLHQKEVRDLKCKLDKLEDEVKNLEYINIFFFKFFDN